MEGLNRGFGSLESCRGFEGNRGSRVSNNRNASDSIISSLPCWYRSRTVAAATSTAMCGTNIVEVELSSGFKPDYNFFVLKFSQVGRLEITVGNESGDYIESESFRDHH